MASGKRSILIVDDQPDSRVFVEAMLSEIGDFDIDTATNGDEAYAKIFSSIPDLAILDVMMPGMDGFTLFRDLRENEATRNIPIVMCTGLSSDLNKKLGTGGSDIGPPPVAFLDKPVEPDALRRVIDNVFGAGAGE